MKCPECLRTIDRPVKVCDCGFILGDSVFHKLLVYFEFKQEHANLSRLHNAFGSELNKLTNKVIRCEASIKVEIDALATKCDKAHAPQHSLPEMPVDKVKKPSPADMARERPAAARPQAQSETPQLEVLLGQKWLLAIGIITMIFGVGYFLKYSFEKGWIGPGGRVALTYLWGIAFMVAGDRFRKKGLQLFGLALIGAGSATFYFATYATFHIYGLFPQSLSFFVMLLVTVLTCVLSIVYDTRWLAVLGLIGGFFTPVMLSTGQDRQIFLMTYMAILNFGIIGIGFYKRWSLLNYLGFFFTYLIYAGWFFEHYAAAKFWPSILFLNLFYFIYCVSPFAYQFFRKNSEEAKDFLIVPFNSFIAFGFSFTMIDNRFSLEWVSVVSLVYSVVFLGMASYLYRRQLHRNSPFVLFVANAALFLIITVPIVFSKHWITIFWATQAVVLLWAAIRLEKRPLAVGSYLLLCIAVVKFLVYDYGEIFAFSITILHMREPYTHMLLERYITSALVLGALYGCVLMARKTGRDDALAISGTFALLFFIILNVETSSFFYEYVPSARFASISVLWTLFSVALMINGFKKNSSRLRTVALVLFAITLAKVFLFDMSKVDTPYRILSFLILGVVMIGTSYLYYRFKDKIIQALSGEAKHIDRHV